MDLQSAIPQTLLVIECVKQSIFFIHKKLFEKGKSIKPNV